MMPRTDRLRLVNVMLGQFITGFAGRSFVVALPTIANTLLKSGIAMLPRFEAPTVARAELRRFSEHVYDRLWACAADRGGRATLNLEWFSCGAPRSARHGSPWPSA